MKIYSIKIDDINDAVLQELCNSIDFEKRERICKYINKRDKIRTLVGDVLIRVLIYMHLDIHNDIIIFLKNEYGKPYIKGFQDFHFNISHSGDYVVCAVSNHPIGIDIERIKHIECEEIAENYFSACELEYVLYGKRNDCLNRFYEIWTLKESYIKCRGMGLSIPLKSFSIEVADTVIKAIVYNDFQYLFRKLDIDSNYAAAVCSQNEEISEDITTISQDILIDSYFKLLRY
jgi:4'-phosphopantetheinyl transferase